MKKNILASTIFVIFATAANAATYTTDTTLNTPVTITTTVTNLGAAVRDGATLTMGTSGSITNTVNSSGGAQNSTALQLGVTAVNSGNLIMTQGSISSIQTGGGNAWAVVVLNADATISGGSVSVDEQDAGLAILFDTRLSSTLNISGGTFSASEIGSQPLQAVIGRNSSIVNVSGGTWTLQENIVDSGDGSIFRATETSQFNISGGSFTDVNDNLTGIEMLGSSTVSLSGLTMEIDTGSGFTPISTGTITASSGNFRITFGDNTVWEDDFTRNAEATFTYTQIPEPSTTTLILSLIIGSVVWFRHN